MHEIISKLQLHFLIQSGILTAKVEIGNPKLCVITGNNVSGKSLLRKILFVLHKDAGIEYIHLSQAGRKSNNALNSFIYGSEEDESTGYNSTGIVLGAIRTGLARTKPFSIMLDEPEIGCSEELALSLGIRIARDYFTMPQMSGMFIVTHSRNLVKPLLPLQPTHIRMGDETTLDQWMNREIIPIESLEDLKQAGLEKWRAIENVLKERKQNKN